jgi:hypothetical protein
MNSDYLNKYSKQLVQIASNLDEMIDYPESLSELTFSVIPTYESLIEHYKAYLSEFPQDDTEERKFFDPNWIPIAVDLEGVFVDPTDPNLCVFGTLRDTAPPYFWRKVVIIDSLNKLILLACDPDSIHRLFQEHAIACMDALYDISEVRTEMIYNGELIADPIEKCEIFPSQVQKSDTQISVDNLHVHIENIYPLCISFLNHDQLIKNLEFKWIDMPVLKEDLVRLTNIRNLITHIRVFEPRLMEHLSLKVEKSNILVYYHDFQVDIFFSAARDLERFNELFYSLLEQ